MQYSSKPVSMHFQKKYYFTGEKHLSLAQLTSSSHYKLFPSTQTPRSKVLEKPVKSLSALKKFSASYGRELKRQNKALPH
jgi:hypothetical protein